MTRRNNTSRRVQAFSSPSMRSDDIAADSMLSRILSRSWSRIWSLGTRLPLEVSDMRHAGMGQISAHGATLGLPDGQNQSFAGLTSLVLDQVTGAAKSVKRVLEVEKVQSAGSDEAIPWRSNSAVR